MNSASASQLCHERVVQDIRSSLPLAYNWLSSLDVTVISDHPIAAGGFANILEATHGDRKVILKSFRLQEVSNVAQITARLRNEVHVCSLLQRDGVNVVRFVGLYSTERHPFGLIYEYDGLDLRQYLRDDPNVERVKLLKWIAQGLNDLHDRGIVHGCFKRTNVLVNKGGAIRIAGLGSACVLAHPTGQTVEGTSGTDLSLRSTPESSVPRLSSDGTDSTHPTKAADVYDFGVMAYEVLTGHSPFSGLTEIAATYSMLKGVRPPRPHDYEISDQMWHMIERCWHPVPSQRMSIGEAVTLIKVELEHTPGSQALS